MRASRIAMMANHAPKESTMNLKASIALVFLILTGIFVLQNMQVVRVDFLFWSLEASRVVIYLTIFLIGAFVGWLGKSLRML